MKSVFEFKTYKGYLFTTFGTGEKRNGQRARLAKHLNCQTAYVSQVLNGRPHFSFEQAHRINSFLGHDREESQYFLLLVSKERAGTHDLADFYHGQMDEILKRRSLIKNRVGKTREIPLEFRTRYFSSWHYAALHMAVAIEGLRTKEALAEYFSLPLAHVAETLEFLVSVGLVVKEGGEYQVGSGYIHLGHDTDHIQNHHLNWRVQAMESLPRNLSQNLHYSSVFCISAEDAERIRERMIAFIKANVDLATPSPSEKIFVSCLDFFELKKSGNTK